MGRPSSGCVLCQSLCPISGIAVTLHEKFKQSFKTHPRRGIRLSAKEKEQTLRILDLCKELNDKITMESYNHHQLLRIIQPMLLNAIQAHACFRGYEDPEPHIENVIHGFIACMGQDAIKALRIGHAILVVDERPS